MAHNLRWDRSRVGVDRVVAAPPTAKQLEYIEDLAGSLGVELRRWPETMHEANVVIRGLKLRRARGRRSP